MFLVVLVLIPCAALALFIVTADVFIAAEDPLHGGVHSEEGACSRHSGLLVATVMRHRCASDGRCVLAVCGLL